MDRRHILKSLGAGFAVTAVFPELEFDVELTADEIDALTRISDKMEHGKVDEMFKTKIVGGSKTAVTVEIEWTDPDVTLLRERGLLG